MKSLLTLALVFASVAGLSAGPSTQFLVKPAMPAKSEVSTRATPGATKVAATNATPAAVVKCGGECSCCGKS